MAIYNLGKILPDFKGQWSPEENYSKLDVVYFEGSSYMAISDNVNKRPDENPNDWVLSAAKGEPGEPGKDGPTYKAGKGIDITNNVISATGGGGGEGGETYYPGYGIEIDLSTNKIIAEVEETTGISTVWETTTIPGMDKEDEEGYDSSNIFIWNRQVFYGNGANHNYWLEYDEATGTAKWSIQMWSGFSDIYGKYIYVDTKNRLHYYYGNTQMIFNNNTSKWEIVSINIPDPRGMYMINGVDGKDYYFENAAKSYYRDDDSTTWTKINNTGADVTADRVWSDSNSSYYSRGTTQYFFDYGRLRWRTMAWRGDLKYPIGNHIWKREGNIFCSNGTATWVLKYGDFWEKVGNTPGVYGESIFTDPESENTYYINNGNARKLVPGERKYITRHGDELARKSDLKSMTITEGYGITTTPIDENTIKIDSVVDKGDGISFNEWKKIADSVKLQDSEGNITVMDPANVVDIFNWKGETFLLISGIMYKFDENELTFSYQSTSEYLIYGRDVYVILNNLHISKGTAQYVYSDENQSWDVFAEWDQFQYLEYIYSARLCSNGSEIVCLKTENVSTTFPYTLYFKDGEWEVIKNDVFVNAFVNIFMDGDGYFYNSKYKFVNKKWILDNSRFNVDNVKRVWIDHENHTFYDDKILIDGIRYDYDWVDLPSMNGSCVFKTSYGTYIYTSAGVYTLRKKTLVDNQGKAYMNEIDVRYLIDCQLGNIDIKLRSI